jgi:hypothetical protein
MREKKRETQTHYNDVIMGNDEKPHQWHNVTCTIGVRFGHVNGPKDVQLMCSSSYIDGIPTFCH